MSRLAQIALLALALTACSGDSTGPEPVIPNLAGRWTFAVTDLAGGTIRCSIVGVVMQLSQNGRNFSGATVINANNNFGQLHCTSGTRTINDVLNASDPIAAGLITGTAVVFDIASSDIHSTGTITGSLITGQTTFKFNDGITITNLVGNFAMVRE